MSSTVDGHSIAWNMLLDLQKLLNPLGQARLATASPLAYENWLSLPGAGKSPFLTPTPISLKQGGLAHLRQGLSALSWASLVTAREVVQGRPEP